MPRRAMTQAHQNMPHEMALMGSVEELVVDRSALALAEDTLHAWMLLRSIELAPRPGGSHSERSLKAECNEAGKRVRHEPPPSSLGARQ